MTFKTHHALAELLIAARRDGRQIIDLDPALMPATPADGYRVNALVADGLGWAPLGWKIAGTNPDMQRRLRLVEPIRGRSFAPFEMASPARFRHSALLDPLIECEFMFRMGDDLPARPVPYRREEIADAVARVHAGVEVAECRFPLASLPPVAAILADGAANGHYVVGPAIADWGRRDLAAMPVTLEVNGKARRHGFGREVMGHPLNAVVWLANHLAQQGDGLKAGELISTGTATGMLLAAAGDVMTARFGDDLAVNLAFDG